MRYSGATQRPGPPETMRSLGDLEIPRLVSRARNGSLPCFAELVKRFEDGRWGDVLHAHSPLLAAGVAPVDATRTTRCAHRYHPGMISRRCEAQSGMRGPKQPYGGDTQGCTDVHNFELSKVHAMSWECNIQWLKEKDKKSIK